MSSTKKFFALLIAGFLVIGTVIAVVAGTNSANEQKATASYTQCMDTFQNFADQQRLAGDSLSSYLAKGAEYCKAHASD